MTVFASTLNDKYFNGACVTLNTLKRNITNILPYHIFLFSDVEKSKIDILNQIYPNLIFHTINDRCYDNYEINNCYRKWDYNVYNRFEIFTLKDCSKIIFLDFDILVRKNIDELVNQRCSFGAVKRFSDNFDDYVCDENFDAGVMVIGEQFISPKTKTDLLELTKKRDWTSDEPVLNVFFNKDWVQLPLTYNTLTPVYNEAIDPHIIQFVGTKKPWHNGEMTDRYDNFIMLNNNIMDLVKIDREYKAELYNLKKRFRHFT